MKKGSRYLQGFDLKPFVFMLNYFSKDGSDATCWNYVFTSPLTRLKERKS
jgi:hypothetical protein